MTEAAANQPPEPAEAPAQPPSDEPAEPAEPEAPSAATPQRPPTPVPVYGMPPQFLEPPAADDEPVEGSAEEAEGSDSAEVVPDVTAPPQPATPEGASPSPPVAIYGGPPN